MKGECFLLLGNEREQKNKFIAGLAKHYPDAENYKYFSFDTPVSKLLDVLNNASLFTAHKIVRYDFAEQVRDKNAIASIKDYVAAPAENTLFLMISDSNSVSAGLSRVFPTNKRKTFWPLYESSLPGWIKQYCSKQDVAITGDAIEMLLERVEHDTEVLREQLERLARISSGTITADEVHAYIYHSKEENVFTLFEALIDCDLGKGLKILENILLAQSGKSTMLLGGLRWQFQKLLEITRLIEQGTPLFSALDDLGIRRKHNRKIYQKALDCFSRSSIEQLLMDVANCETRLRSTDAEFEQVALELLCYKTTKLSTR